MTGVVTGIGARRDLCQYVTGRGEQCRRNPNTTVTGVDARFCRQHARIVATEPGASGYVRVDPVGVDAIVAELHAASTQADVDRCRGAIARQLDVCGNGFGLKPEISSALRDARSRVRLMGGR